jgi:hypothetical protein
MSDEDIDLTFDIADEAFTAVRRNHPEMFN